MSSATNPADDEQRYKNCCDGRNRGPVHRTADVVHESGLMLWITMTGVSTGQGLIEDCQKQKAGYKPNQKLHGQRLSVRSKSLVELNSIAGV